MMCSICKKNPAVVFVNRLDKNVKESKEENTNSMVGLCMDCARNEGVNIFDTLMNNLGMSKEELQEMNQQFSGLMKDPNNMQNLNNILGNFDGFGGTSEEVSGYNIENDSMSDKKAKGSKKKKRKILDSFGVNLTLKAKQGKIDKLIGRESELDRVIQILNRRSKNNPVLLGEPGVGKTAIANGLALAIAEATVPAKLIGKEVYQIEIPTLLAGTQFRGQFEARLKDLIDECKDNGNIILVIDELHTLTGSGDHDQALNAGNILKPALANGDIQVLGATTLKEYRKHIEKDSALERRFQPVIVEEPSIEESIKIISGLKKYYEDFHNVVIPDEIVKQSVLMSEKYIHDRFLPDKAIDLLDEACSRLNLNNKKLSEIETLRNKLVDIELSIQDLEEADANSPISNKDSEPNPDNSLEIYKELAGLKVESINIQEKLEKLNSKLKHPTLDIDEIAHVVNLWTKIPAERLTQSDTDKLVSLDKHLQKKIVGQDIAIASLSNAIKRKRCNLRNYTKPASFVFVGPTGTGKTALAKALAYELFDSEENIIRFDMSEYMESHSVAKLIGSPPGYVGFDDAGQLTEKVRRKPYSIILFDEIEKAHPNIFNLLLQILDEGRLTDSQGRTVSFRHTVIILTSNIGTNFKNDGFGFNSGEDYNLLETKVNNALKEQFAPEFLNRIDEVIIFKKLSKENLFEIFDIMSEEIIKDFNDNHISLTIPKEVKEYIIQKSYDEKYGARPLKRGIQKYIEDVVIHQYINGNIKKESSVSLKISNDLVVVE